MRKKIIISLVLFIAIVFLSGCAAKDQAGTGNVPEAEKGKEAGPCEKGKVEITGYGDPGKRLANCFVEYPGEPTRQDKSYYIVEDICGQFTKEFVENILGQKIVKVQPSETSILYNCRYYLDDKENILINLEYLAIENQKKFFAETGGRTEKNSKIPMDNLVVLEGPKSLQDTIYLVLDPKKFISINPSSENALKGEKLIDFAAKVGAAIKDYK